MTEINNNNRHNYTVKKNNLERAKDINEVKPSNKDTESSSKTQQEYFQDTGVVGRSQVSDVSRIVDEAVFLAKNNPTLLSVACSVSDQIYDELKAEGCSDYLAYVLSADALRHVAEIAPQHCK